MICKLWILKLSIVILKNIYLAASDITCGRQGIHCIMQDLLLWCPDSLIVVLRLSCSMACGILVPRADQNYCYNFYNFSVTLKLVWNILNIRITIVNKYFTKTAKRVLSLSGLIIYLNFISDNIIGSSGCTNEFVHICIHLQL